MSLTVRFIKQHKHLGLTFPVQINHSYLPLNVKIHIDNDVKIKIVSPNANGLIPFPTHLVFVAMPAGVQDPLTLTAEHNLNIGTDKLVFVQPTGFKHKFSVFLVKSNHNEAMAQLQPVAGPHKFGGGVPSRPAPAAAAAYAAAPVHAARPAHAAVPPRTMSPAREDVSAVSIGSTHVALPTGAAASSASASTALSASSAFLAAASASA